MNGSKLQCKLAVHFVDKTLIGDITVVQTKNATFTKNVEMMRDKTDNKWSQWFLTVDIVLAPPSASTHA
jgi:hypothetical protein